MCMCVKFFFVKLCVQWNSTLYIDSDFKTSCTDVRIYLSFCRFIVSPTRTRKKCLHIVTTDGPFRFHVGVQRRRRINVRVLKRVRYDTFGHVHVAQKHSYATHSSHTQRVEFFFVGQSVVSGLVQTCQHTVASVTSYWKHPFEGRKGERIVSNSNQKNFDYEQKGFFISCFNKMRSNRRITKPKKASNRRMRRTRSAHELPNLKDVSDDEFRLPTEMTGIIARKLAESLGAVTFKTVQLDEDTFSHTVRPNLRDDVDPREVKRLVDVIEGIYNESKEEVLMGLHNMKPLQVTADEQSVTVSWQKDSTFYDSIPDHLKWDKSMADNELETYLHVQSSYLLHMRLVQQIQRNLRRKLLFSFPSDIGNEIIKTNV